MKSQPVLATPVLARVLPLALLVAMAAVSGCRCQPRGTGNTYGEVRVVVFTDGVPTFGQDGTYDFGAISMGKTVTTKLTIQNAGNGVLTLKSLAKQSGDAVVLGTDVVEPDPVFSIGFQTADVAVGETREFDITYTPPTEMKPVVDHLAVVRLFAGNTAAGKDTSIITLRGQAVSGECELPEVIDFGAVARGETTTFDVQFPNTRPIDTSAFVGDIESPQGAGIFVLSPASPRGTFNIASKKEKVVTFTFTPTEPKNYLGSVTMRKAEGCLERRVRLFGTGVDQVLTWSPASIDFGYVTPGQMAGAEVTFANQSINPVAISMLNTFENSNPSAIFKVVEAGPGDPTRLVVPAAKRNTTTMAMDPGLGTVKLTFKPNVLGPKTGTLRAATDLRNQSGLVVNLRGVGGGPDIDLRPASPLSFGRVAYFANASPASFAVRKLIVANVGTRPNPPDAKANLRLGPGGVGGAGKYWKVTAMQGSLESELCVGLYDSGTGACANDLPATGAGKYDPNVGIEAAGASALLDIPVRITPVSLGDKAWTVTIYSNDPDEPEVTITVKATVVDVPPCNVSVTPIALPFGVVTPPLTKDLGFQVRNMGTQPGDVCLITNLTLLPETGTPTGMPPVFSLPAGDVPEKELMPGETWQVLTRAWPQGPVPAVAAAVTGRVQFNLSNPNNPVAGVTLTATIAPSCLTIAPSDLDFGTVQKDCNSPDRSFLVYNTCSQNITVTSSGLVAAAGLPANSPPACPGASPCPEFFVTSALPNGTVLSPGAATPPSFRIKYHPINFGPDTGAFRLSVTQGGQNVDYIVTLRGAGDTMGLNTDTFRQDARPKADILLVLDDSCSMNNKLNALASNMTSFLQYARSSQVDFNIAATNTEIPSAKQGTFFPSPSGLKILTPTTPNLESEYAGLIRNFCPNGSCPGGTESCLEGAYKGLTQPLITGANAGFLRQDAVLAVVCVTDAEDQGNQPIAVYLNTLLNIKGAQRQSMFTYNVIGPFLGYAPTGCSYDENNYVDPTKHLAMVGATNGVKEEICTPDWASALQNIGKSAFGYRTSFYLTARPDLSSSRPIEVGIDSMSCTPSTGCPTGQTCSPQSSRCVLPQTTGTGARVWAYEPSTNSVNFDPLYVPEPGKTLTVTYQVACN